MIDDEAEADDKALVRLSAEIVASYVEASRLAPDQLAGLIASVHQALAGLGSTETAPAPQPKTATKAEIRRSIRPDGIVSFEDGKVYKTLKRHLARQGLTPAEYRAKWGLPEDYPMVAPEYAARRSELAKAAGLGVKAPTRRRAKR